MGKTLLESLKKKKLYPDKFCCFVLALGPSKHTQRAPVKLWLHFLNIPLPPTTLENKFEWFILFKRDKIDFFAMKIENLQKNGQKLILAITNLC